jgi:hypothetical protein
VPAEGTRGDGIAGGPGFKTGVAVPQEAKAEFRLAIL